MAGQYTEKGKARSLQILLGADPALCNVAYSTALQWVRDAGDQPWQDFPAFVEACRAKAKRVQS